MRKKLIAAAHKLNTAIFNCSQVQERTLSCTYAHTCTQKHINADSVLDIDLDNIPKIKPSQRCSFMDPIMPKTAPQRSVSWTRMPWSDLCKAPGNLQCGRINTSSLIYLIFMQMKPTDLGIPKREPGFPHDFDCQIGCHVSYSWYICGQQERTKLGNYQWLLMFHLVKGILSSWLLLACVAWVQEWHHGNHSKRPWSHA